MSDNTLTVFVYDPERLSKEIATARVPPKGMSGSEWVAYIEGFHKGMQFMLGGRKIVLDPDNPPKAWAEWAEQGPLEWKFFLNAWLRSGDE